jgi:hypothetical protein
VAVGSSSRHVFQKMNLFLTKTRLPLLPATATNSTNFFNVIAVANHLLNKPQHLSGYIACIC